MSGGPREGNERSREARRVAAAAGRDERVRRSLAWLARYEPLLDDERAFRAALDAHPPVDLLVLPARATRDGLAAGLAARDLPASTFDAAPWHLRVHGHEGSGTLPEVLFGFAYPQGVSSALGPQALAPREGERVLDACAAPGGKTALLDALAGGGTAMRAADGGCASGSGGCAAMLAGEPAGRAGLLVQTLARCATTSTMVVQQDAQAFPAVGPFDVLLLDAPCTGEGTFRVPAPRFDVRGDDSLASASALQRRLLGRALDLLAPGGRMVYSTCAYSPEENEAVLDEVLAKRDDVVVAPLPAGTPGLPGLASWQGRVFRGDIAHARRVLPHHLGSWGFFVALLRKDPASERTARPRFRPNHVPAPLVDDPEARALALSHFETYFGADPSAFDGQVIAPRGRDLWALAAGTAAYDTARLNVVAPGLRLLHRTGRSWQASNAALRWLGARVTRSVVELTMERAIEALAGPIPVPGEADRPVVAVRVGGVTGAKGRIAGGMLSIELPAGWR